MKKVLIGILAIIMVLGLVGCSIKSNAAIEAEEAIAAIGEITIDSSEAISNAEKKYNILTENEKEMVKNRQDLVNARKEYESLVAAKKKEEEYAKINAALPEAQKLVKAFQEAMDDLEFIAKYAGNVNGSGSRKFADSFINEMITRFDNIDMDLISEGMPELAKGAYEIQTNYYNIGNLLIDMGRTNSDENVSTIKQMSLDTLDMISKLTEEQLDYVNSLLEEENIQ